MRGDQTLFAREDWIDHTWSIVDPVVSQRAEHPREDLPNYAAGGWGAQAAAALLERDGRQWMSVWNPGAETARAVWTAKRPSVNIKACGGHHGRRRAAGGDAGG